MRSVGRIYIPVAMSFLFAVCAPNDAKAGEVNLFVGSKTLDESDWSPFDQHVEVGIEASWGDRNWPVLLATDVFGSFDDAEVASPLGPQNFEASTGELDLGARKIWNVGSRGRFHPYLGGGIAFVRAEVEIPVTDSGSETVEDNGVGAWIGGGAFWRLGSRFNLGFSVRGSSAEVAFPLFDPEEGDQEIEVDAGGGHFGVVLGWGWPAAGR